MASKLIGIADALVVSLKAATLGSDTFEVCRRIVPIFNLTDVGIQLVVVAGGASWNMLTRGSLSEDEKIVDIGVFSKLGGVAEAPDLETDCPIMLEFVENLVTWLKSNRRQGGFVLLSIANDPIYDADKLRTDHSFVSVLRLTFKGSD